MREVPPVITGKTRGCDLGAVAGGERGHYLAFPKSGLELLDTELGLRKFCGSILVRISDQEIAA